MSLNIDAIEVGKTYKMQAGICARTVLDIIWHPAGSPYVGEYREAITEMADGKRVGFVERVPLQWLVHKAVRALP